MEGPSRKDRLLATMERLLEVPSTDLKVALTAASDVVASALGADKVDVFLYDASRDSLVAESTSTQPLSALQHQHGLDVLQIANGGRVVQVFKTGKTFFTGHLESDPEELRGVREVLRIRSKIGIPLEVGGKRRGVLMFAALSPDRWNSEDAAFAESTARWVAVLAHRAELVEQITRNASEQGRRAVAEELITVLAHDLRNYLSPIDLRLRLLKRRAERDQRDADASDLDLAARAIARLAGLIANILDVARIDQGLFRLDLQPVDLVSLLEETAATFSSAVVPVVVKAAESVQVSADPDRLRQCIENLISNAVKHSPEGAAVTVLVSNSAGCAKVEVLDQGPGVSPAMLPRIFDRFVSGERREGGLGLGLYLARRIAVMHAGNLTVESSPGRGARFVLTLQCKG
jgi:two-component system OmpR family sensor kinase